ncbi:MAG: hypothetical protein AAGJ81_13530 [Verrucomicrobiota bacterium]
MKTILVLACFLSISGSVAPFDHIGENYWVIFEDFTGDARTDIAITSARPWGNAGMWWWIYSAQPDGSYTYFDDVFFHPKAFRIYPLEKNGAELVTYYRSDSNSGSLITYRIQDEIEETSKVTIYPKEGDQELYEDHFSYLWKFPRALKIPTNKIRFDGNSLSIQEH